MNSLETINLNNAAQGVANNLFMRELESVIENINDKSTYAVEKRKITLEFEFKPDENRDTVDISVTAKSKLIGARAVMAKAYVAKDKLYSTDPQQTEFNMDNVSPMESERHERASR